MKIIRPQNNTTKTKLMTEPQIKQNDDILVDDNTYKVKEVELTENGVNLTLDNFFKWKAENNINDKDQTIENLMDEIIKQKDDKIQVTISLTKRQYDLYLKKGGESWIKKAITGQQVKKKSSKKR